MFPLFINQNEIRKNSGTVATFIRLCIRSFMLEKLKMIAMTHQTARETIQLNFFVFECMMKKKKRFLKRHKFEGRKRKKSLSSKNKQAQAKGRRRNSLNDKQAAKEGENEFHYF